MFNNFEKIYSSVLTGKENLSHKEVQVLCPFHNDHEESMSINVENGLYYCFACGAKGDAINFFMKTRGVDYKTALKELGEFNNNYTPTPTYVSKTAKNPPKIEQKNEIKEDFEKYILQAFDNVVKYWDFFYKKLYELRGITLDTAACCMIGYDKNKGWIFPIIRYPDMKFVGYEIREKNFGIFNFNKRKCYKAPNSHSCLSVTHLGDNKKAIICEGFIDSYKMYQYLHEKVQIQQRDNLAQVSETILTPSMGVKTIPELVMELELWKQFDEIVFCLDNDKAGNETSDKLRIIRDNHKDKPNFTFFGGIAEGEDFENWYDKFLKRE